MSSFGVEKAIVFRQPATANLMIDSKDRDEAKFSSPWNFQINKKQSIQNGFMTRVGTTEVVLEWYVPNIYDDLGNNTVVVDICGTGIVSNHTITLPNGFYTVAQAWNYIADAMTDLSGTSGVAFRIINYIDNFSEYQLEAVGGEFAFVENTRLAQQLLIPFGLAEAPSLPLFLGADLRPYRYLDFTSAQLTYNQDLKDNSTADINRDVLCRWYMAYDNQTPNTTAVDQYGFPILMGYEPFVLRRLFNPPKQIKWDSAQPIGSLGFEVYGDNGNLVLVDDNLTSQWLMTLQLSEN